MPGYSRQPERNDTNVIGARVVAQIADQIFGSIIAAAIFFTAGLLGGLIGASIGGLIAGSGLLLAVLVFLGYFFVLEGMWDGHTLGKKLMGIKVVKGDGSECDIGASLIRNLLRIIDGMFYYAVGFIFMASSNTRQRIGEKAASTVVVREG